MHDSRSEPARDGRDPDVPMASDVPTQGGKETKGKKTSEVGKCPDCEGKTTNKEGKIAKQHGMTVKEVKAKIHGGSKGSLPDNPDLEVCQDCGGMFPQTESGELGDVIDDKE